MTFAVLILAAVTALAVALYKAQNGRFAAACLAAALCITATKVASYADDAGAPAAAVTAGSGSASDAGSAVAPGSGSASGIATSPPATIAPAPAPTTSGGIWNRLVTDWHDGKLLDLVVLVMFALVWFAKDAPLVGPWLSKGSRAGLVAAALAALTTGLSTLASKTVTLDWLGGSLMAGILLYIKSHGASDPTTAPGGPAK